MQLITLETLVPNDGKRDSYRSIGCLLCMVVVHHPRKYCIYKPWKLQILHDRIIVWRMNQLLITANFVTRKLLSRLLHLLWLILWKWQSLHCLWYWSERKSIVLRIITKKPGYHICFDWMFLIAIFLAVPRGPAVARGPQARPLSVQQTPSGSISLLAKWWNSDTHNNR